MPTWAMRPGPGRASASGHLQVGSRDGRYPVGSSESGGAPPLASMFTLIGLVIVFGSVLGGFAMVGGNFAVLIQPSELVVIGGAAVGTLIAAAPGKMRGRLFATIAKAFKADLPAKADYLELLKLQYEVFSFMRKNGAVALDEHVNE